MKDRHQENKRRYQALLAEVSAVLHRHDPVIGFASDLPADEYEPEARTILVRLSDAKDVFDVERIVHQELDRWFGPLPQPFAGLHPIARDIWDAWQRLRPI